MYSQNSILGDACFNKCFELVKYLVEHGADVNTGKDAGMRTPLFWAAWGMDKKNNDLKIVKYLVENGAEINTQTKYDGTPLHSAYMGKKYKYILLDRKRRRFKCN
jgi:ankyrin repeat protein